VLLEVLGLPLSGKSGYLIPDIIVLMW